MIITIVVILILLSVILAVTVGNEGLFNTTENTLEGHSVLTVIERLNSAKGATLISGKGKIIPDEFFDIIEKNGIIASRDDSVIDIGGGVYEIVTPEGYIIEVTLLPSPDTLTDPIQDIEFEYIGKMN